MNIAVNLRHGRQNVEPVQVLHASKVDRVEVITDMKAAEPYWRRLEDGGAFATPYQRFDLLAAWQHHAGVKAGVVPFLVTGFDRAGEPMFLWPFGRRHAGTLGIIEFLGSKHANFNVGLWRRDVVATITAQDIRDVFDRIAAGDHGVDLGALFSQPPNWDGVANPFMLLPHQASVDMSARLTIARSTDNVISEVLSSSMRGRLRTKERKLQKLPGYRYIRVATAEEIDRLLDQFFVMKSAHMAAQGLTDVFAEPGVADFFRDACHHKLANGSPLIEIHALEGGDEMLAIFGAVVDDYRFSSMFNTYTLGDNARHSPGLILLVHMIDECTARGTRSFDIGVGRAHYKSFFCKEPEPLYDIFLPLSLRGRLVAPVMSAASAAKRVIKDTPALWAGVQALRRLRARR